MVSASEDPEEQRADARERWETAAPRWEDRVGGFLDGTLALAHWMVDALAPQPGAATSASWPPSCCSPAAG
jgi:hypothetical protein